MPPFDAAVGQLHGKAVRVVISTGSVLAFAERHSPEFAASDDQGFLQKCALFKIGEQRGDRPFESDLKPTPEIGDRGQARFSELRPECQNGYCSARNGSNKCVTSSFNPSDV